MQPNPPTRRRPLEAWRKAMAMPDLPIERVGEIMREMAQRSDDFVPVKKTVGWPKGKPRGPRKPVAE